MSASSWGWIRRPVSLLITLVLAFAGIALIGPAATAASGAGASHQVAKVAKKKAKKKARKKTKARSGNKARHPRGNDGGSTRQPEVAPRHETVNPRTGSDNPTWADQLSDEEKVCLATKAAEILTQNPLEQANMLTLMSYLPELESAVAECGVTPPSETEMQQMRVNVFFWYLALSAEQKTCLMDEWQEALDAGVQPDDDVLAMLTNSLSTCGVTAPFGLG